MSCSSDRITELAPFLSDFRSKDELGSASDREESCAIRHAEKLSKVYSEAPFEDKREPDADCEQSDRCLTDPEPDMEMRQAHFRNMRSKCRCSCVLQFTRHHGVSSVLHRPPS